MLQVQTLLERLSKYYWSDNHPGSYLLDLGNGPKAGLGLVAHLNYAAFSLTWATCKLETKDDHLSAVRYFTKLSVLLNQEVSGCSLTDHITLRTPQEFAAWYSQNRSLVNPALRKPIEDALSAMKVLE